MKNLLIFSLLLSVIIASAQPNTEVYLLDINLADDKIEFLNLRNISNNQGYDNQPSFYDDDTVLYSSTRNGQTDIAKFNISTGQHSWVSDTPGGSEYSPIRIPASDDISAVRLDTTGYQRLYRYNTGTGTSEEILKDQKVGYHVWNDHKTLITTILVENGMNLMVSDLEKDSNRTVDKGVGRSLHQIPGSNLVGFIKFEDDPFTINSLEPSTGKIEVLKTIMSGISDICWLPDGSILAPDGNSISKINPQIDAKWKHIWQFEGNEIGMITRMAVSPNGKHMALVSQRLTELPVQKQVVSFNAANLDAFARCYADDVIVRNFPNDTLYVGNDTLKANYKRYFENSPKTAVEVVTRLQIGNTVIDEELIHRSGGTNRQVAIYVIDNGKIASMTFIQDKEIVPEAEAIIEENLKAYRARDIEAFLSDYSNDVQAYMFPDKWLYTGKEKMRISYSDFLKGAEDFTCEIKNRIVLGNIVIDEEYITINGNKHSAVVIYQLAKGEISKVTFIQ